VKLPLDNFQILGVSPTSNTRNILTMLERKLERCDYTELTAETLNKRNELVKEYTKPLLDDEKRKEYEKTFKNRETVNNEAFFLPVAKGYELAGLLLLLESKQYEECLTLAMSCLDSQQALSYDSKQNTDLYRIIAYSTLEYARELKLSRYFEFSAKVLEHGLGLLDNDVVLPPKKDILQSELNDLTPYRILDLLSRNTDDPTREKGIELLKIFVVDRGGLDGISSLYMNDSEFKAFFRQIRYFLTFQEQIDLYQEWSNCGSESASFLLGISLVACGFARRKPERLVQALVVMTRLGGDELDIIIKYIHLLLGNVYIGREDAHDIAKPKSTLSSPSSDVDLAKFCSDCREWLETDVLDGYRDIEIDSDLEAYFSDRDVTSFIEKNDITLKDTINRTKNSSGLLDINNTLFSKLSNSESLDWNSLDTKPFKPTPRASQKNVQSLISRLIQSKHLSIFIILIISVSLLSLIGLKQNQQNINQPRQSNPIQTRKNNVLPQSDDNKSTRLNQIRNNKMPNQLRSYPSEIEIRSIISNWLSIKAEALSGKEITKEINSVATSEAIKRLEAERLEDQMRGETQRISANLINLKILTRGSDKIEVDALLSYSDQRLNEKKLIVDKTPQHTFKKRYILVNRNSIWKLL
jgi:hypothetical protein